MHSKHHPNAPHTMAATYTPHYTRSHSHPNTHHHHHRPTTWPETQAALILTLRDISNPPRKSPDADVRALNEDRQIHARWTDPDLVDALAQLLESVPSNDELSLRYGGRDVTEATWVNVYQTTRRGTTKLRNVLWFHEYDDLDVEVGELADVEWGIEKKEDGQEEMDMVVKKEEEEVDVGVKVKIEDVGMDG